MKGKVVIYALWGTLVLTGGIVLLSWRRRAANIAASFINEMEIGNNQGFADTTFQLMLQDVGWQGGEAWCMYFAKAVYMQAFAKRAAAIAKVLTGSTQTSFENAKAHPELFKVITSGKPMVGDIVIWQSASNPSLGHAGIVLKSLGDSNYKTVEGNSGFGGTREGQGVSEHERYLVPGYPDGDLKVLGFIRMKL